MHNENLTTTITTAAATAQKLTEALNSRDRAATQALFAPDCTFMPAANGSRFDGPEAATGALFAWLERHEYGQFETVQEFFSGDEGFSEWRFIARTNDGENVTTHGCDFFRFRDGLIVEKNAFRKI